MSCIQPLYSNISIIWSEFVPIYREITKFLKNFDVTDFNFFLKKAIGLELKQKYNFKYGNSLHSHICPKFKLLACFFEILVPLRSGF